MALFVDIVTVQVKAGNGGNGKVSFHREKYVQAGGPDGGDGGRGGNVIFVASERMHTLMDFRYRREFSAEDGQDGQKGRCKGKGGQSIEIQVPVGTVVRDVKTGKVLLDMNEPEVKKTLLVGGMGGYGNARFATPTRQTPGFAKPGVRVEGREVSLELKSIADVGLVGFPNVGKSTILSAVTAARPKIADYHFTTLNPNLGIVVQDEMSFVLADIPGLVEGAAEGVGLGHQFLRHVERTRMLIHVVDISGCEGRDPLEDFDVIMSELSKYGDLGNRPMLVAANKSDLATDEENLRRLKDKLSPLNMPVFPLSAATGKGVRALMRETAALLQKLPPSEPFYEEELSEFSETESLTIRHEEGVYVVEGAAIDHLIRSVNFEDEDSLNWFHRTLRKMGVIDRLREQGAEEGATVRISDMEFDFID